MQKLSIGKIATRAGVGIDTVRFYERAGLLPRPDRTASGYRLYGEAEAARLRFIKRGKALGFTLEEIRELLALNDARGNRATVRRLAQQRLDEIEEKVRELTRIRNSLRGLLRQCHGDGALDGCPIIEAVRAPGDCQGAKAHPAKRKTTN